MSSAERLASVHITKKPKGYLAQSRDPINSLLLVAPLFVVYQVGILFTDGWKNGADFVTRSLMALTNGNMLWYSGLNLIVLVAMMIAYSLRKSSGGLHASTLVGVFVESTVYAIFMGGIAGRLLMKMGLRPPLSNSVPITNGEPNGFLDAIVLSIGAGTYEELLFRLLLMGGMLIVLTKLFGPALGSLAAVLGSSLIFSAFHYWPFGMDSWELWSFSFRFVLGCFLALVFLTRGFAVAVYTHAIYDLIILVPRALFS